MQLEQNGCLSRFRGCKDHLLLDKTICTHAKSHKRNLTTAWLDVRKAYDSEAHTWIIAVLEKLKIASNIKKTIENSMRHWHTTIEFNGASIANVKINWESFRKTHYHQCCS